MNVRLGKMKKASILSADNLNITSEGDMANLNSNPVTPMTQFH